MARFVKLLVFSTVLLSTFALRHLETTQAGNVPAEGKEAALKAADITAKLFPERVFFRGQSAPGQFRLLDQHSREVSGLSSQRSDSGDRRTDLEARRLRVRVPGRRQVCGDGHRSQ